jgi:hypothetical protein
MIGSEIGYDPQGAKSGPRLSLGRMSLADAYLVRLVELTSQATLFTVDTDIPMYRQKGWRVLPLLAP